MTISHRKHTVIQRRDLGLQEDVNGEIITYTLSPEELSKYHSLPMPEKMSKPFALPVRK